MLSSKSVLLDRWRLDRTLGAGSAGVVMRATDLRDGSVVAIKLLHHADVPAVRRRFEREVRTWRSIDHPGVVRLLEGPLIAPVDDLRDATFLVLEYVGGGTLERMMEQVGAMSADEALELLVPIVGTVGALHDAGIVHRDMKPANVLLDELGLPRVTDLGVAHLADATRITAVGAVLGTPRYAAPEQLAGGQPDPRWDVYALGRIGIEMVGEGDREQQLRVLLERMASIDPDRRPSDCREVLDSLSLIAPKFTQHTTTAVQVASGVPEATTETDDPRWLRLLGTKVDGRYELRRVLGRGASALVFRALDCRLDRDVALKVLLDERAGQRAREEAASIARLDHDAIVRVQDWGTWAHDGGNDPFIVTDLVEGTTLAELLESSTIDPGVAMEEFARLLDALTHAHARGVVHGDVKPANVLVDAHGAWRLTDFGLSVAGSDDGAGFRGSVPWAAPELLEGSPADPASDQWAAAVVGLEALAGHRPFEGGSVHATAVAIAECEPDLAGLAPALRPVFERAFSRSPADRWASPAEFARRLRHAGPLIDSVAVISDESHVTEPLPQDPDREPPPVTTVSRRDILLASLVAATGTAMLVASIASYVRADGS